MGSEPPSFLLVPGGVGGPGRKLWASSSWDAHQAFMSRTQWGPISPTRPVVCLSWMESVTLFGEQSMSGGQAQGHLVVLPHRRLSAGCLCPCPADAHAEGLCGRAPSACLPAFWPLQQPRGPLSRAAPASWEVTVTGGARRIKGASKRCPTSAMHPSGSPRPQPTRLISLSHNAMASCPQPGRGCAARTARLPPD